MRRPAAIRLLDLRQRLHQENTEWVTSVGCKRFALDKTRTPVEPESLERFDPCFQEQCPDTLPGGGMFNCLNDGAANSLASRGRIDEQALHLCRLLWKEHVATAPQGTAVLPGNEESHIG